MRAPALFLLFVTASCASRSVATNADDASVADCKTEPGADVVGGCLVLGVTAFALPEARAVDSSSGEKMRYVSARETMTRETMRDTTKSYTSFHFSLDHWIAGPATYPVDVTGKTSMLIIEKTYFVAECPPPSAHVQAPDCNWQHELTAAIGNGECAPVGANVACRFTDLPLEDGRRASGWVHAPAP